MKRESRFSLLATFVGIMVVGGLLMVPAPSIAKTIKGNIVDVVAESIANITVTIKTDAGETKTFKVTDPRMTQNLHFGEPATIEVDDKGNVTNVAGEWQTKIREQSKIPKQ